MNPESPIGFRFVEPPPPRNPWWQRFRRTSVSGNCDAEMSRFQPYRQHVAAGVGDMDWFTEARGGAA